MGGEDTVANIILETEPNAPIASARGLELHHPIISMLGGHGGRLERERERVIFKLHIPIFTS